MTRQWETIREYKEIKYELYDASGISKYHMEMNGLN